MNEHHESADGGTYGEQRRNLAVHEEPESRLPAVRRLLRRTGVECDAEVWLLKAARFVFHETMICAAQNRGEWHFGREG